MPLIYKILCDVKWMHEYYLTGSNGQGVFDFPLQTDRMNFLFEQFHKDAPTINSNLEFLVPELLKPQFSNYSLKVIPSYSGFKLAVQCSKKILPDGSTVYTPLAGIPVSEPLLVMIKERDTIRTFSNLSMSMPFRSAWYFSNDEFPVTKTFPFLCGPADDFDPAVIYAQGDIVVFGGNDAAIFLNNGTPDPWLHIPGINYITNRDRMVVPLSFTYSFTAADNVTDASFSLKDNTNTEVKVFEFSGTDPLQTAYLNFRLPDNPIQTIPSKTPSPQVLYTLEVTSTNGYTRLFRLLFADDKLNIADYTAIIGLTLRPTNPDFNLLDNNGFLNTRILPNGIRTEPPVFELWMKSRLVFWQYRNNRRKKIKLTPDTQDLLTDVDGILTTKNPQRLAYAPFGLKKPDNSFQFLPNPSPGDQVRADHSGYFVNIIVPASKMFPLV